MNYDTMSVHELVSALVYEPDNLNVHVDAMYNYHKDHDIIESALRRAVVREASVGKVSIKQQSCGLDGLPLIDNLVLTRRGDPFAWTTYDLIPHKETT